MEFVIEQGSPRLDALLHEKLPGHSRSALQKLIRNGACLLNGRPETGPATRLRPGDRISLALQDSSGSVTPEEGEIELLYADADLAVCSKPAGSTTHPCPSCPQDTYIQKLASHFPALLTMPGPRPGIVHRLDKDTSGLLLVALNEPARLDLADQFARRAISKEYLAIVHGQPRSAGECHLPIGRDPASKIKMAVVPESAGGRPAHTDWRVLWQSPTCALLAIRLFTGRTHQIRVHMAALGHPLLGDATYAPPAIAKMAPRQMLHAWRLAFTHPGTSQPMAFTLPPADFRDCLLLHARATRRLVVTGVPGCGKSAFCKLLPDMPRISADDIVAQLYGPGGKVAAWLYSNAAPDLLNADGSVNKAQVQKLLARNDRTSKAFNDLVHGLVLQRIQTFFTECETALAPLACAEIPLYFECGWSRLLPAISIGVQCDDAIRRQRLADIRHWDADKIQAIDSWQLPQSVKMAKCDIVCPNNGSLAALQTRAREIAQSLQDDLKREQATLLKSFEDTWGKEPEFICLAPGQPNEDPQELP